MRNIFVELISNRILIPVLIAWVSAQMLKFLLTLLTKKRVDWVRLIGTGGMPSTHSASVMALAVLVGLYNGFNSQIFAVVFVFAMVVMFDAAGIRMAASRQARLLNELIENFFKEHYVNQRKLKELLGHTPFEVLAGAIWGAIVAVISYALA